MTRDAAIHNQMSGHISGFYGSKVIESRPPRGGWMVNEVIALVRRELLNHRVSPWMELAPALPVVAGDRVQLRQVIINLAIHGIESLQAVTKLWAEPNLPQGGILHFTLLCIRRMRRDPAPNIA